MNQSEFRKILQINVNDIRGSRFDSDTCRILLNSAFQHVWNDLINKGRYYNIQTVNVTFSTLQEVDLAEDVQKVILVKDSDGNKIDIFDEEVASISDKQGVYLTHQVNSITMIAMVKLGWYRIPASSFILTVRYVPIVSQFSAIAPDDNFIILDIPIQYHLLIPTWATVLALGADEKSVDYWGSIYQQQMQQIVESGSHTPAPKEVKDVDNWYA